MATGSALVMSLMDMLSAPLVMGAMIWLWPGVVAVGLLVMFGVVLWWVRHRHRQEIEALQASHRESLAIQDSGHREHVYRLQREQSQALERASFGLVRDLLPAFDALHEAIASAHQRLSKEDGQASEYEAMLEGLLMIEKALLSALERHGITPVEAVPGTPYDPHVHEAIGVISTDAVPSGTVAVLLRSGWQHPAGLLRAAMVQTATAPPPPPPSPVQTPATAEAEDIESSEQLGSSDDIEMLLASDLAEET